MCLRCERRTQDSSSHNIHETSSSTYSIRSSTRDGLSDGPARPLQLVLFISSPTGPFRSCLSSGGNLGIGINTRPRSHPSFCEGSSDRGIAAPAPGAHPSWLPVPGLALTLTLIRTRTRSRTRDTHNLCSRIKIVLKESYCVWT